MSRRRSQSVQKSKKSQSVRPNSLDGLDGLLTTLATGGTGDKEKAAVKFKGWLKSRKPLDIIVYTDGSQEIDQNNVPTGTGAGWILNWVGGWHQKQGIPLEKISKVYDAEAVAMLEGLRQALKSPIARVAPGIHICLDNLGVARNTNGIPKSSSQKAFKQFRDLAKGWLQTGKELTVQWIPGHAGIEGNELADQKAKKYAKRPPVVGLNLHQSLSNAKRKIRMKKDINWQLEWQKGTFSGAAQTYVELGLKPTLRAKSLPELRLKRKVQGWLIAARSGHGHFSAYHERFGHEETDAECVCGQRRAQLHPFSYPKAKEHRLHLWCKKRQNSLRRSTVTLSGSSMVESN